MGVPSNHFWAEFVNLWGGRARIADYHPMPMVAVSPRIAFFLRGRCGRHDFICKMLRNLGSLLLDLRSYSLPIRNHMFLGGIAFGGC